jgi:hypothetical protein
MKITTSLLLFVGTFAWFAVDNALATTVPAGTSLVVKTLDVISSSETPGKKFPTVLLHDVAVKGRVVLPAGTKVTAKIVTSKRMSSSAERLTVNLTDVMVGGHAIPLRTTGAVKVENYTSSRGVSISPGYYHVAKGKKLHFRLGEPLKL